MLTQTTRGKYATLLDAVTLTSDNATQPALIFVETGQEPITITRQQFCEQVNAYASAMLGAGINANDLVIIAHVQNLESIFALWGALLIGAVPAMFPTLTEKHDPDSYMRDMAQLVKISKASAILTSDTFAPQLMAMVDCPVYGSNILRGNRQTTPALPQYKAGSEEIAFLQHSSGTTGLQKGVALSHRAVLNQLASYSDALSLSERDVIVSWLPLYHDMGLIAGFLLPVVQGIPLVIMSPFDWVSHPALLFQAIDRYGGTLCWLPNFAYNHCARRIRQRDLDGLSLDSVRAFINCSEPVRYDSHQLFLERFSSLGISAKKLAVSYAMAENVFAVTQSPIGQPARVDWVEGKALAEQLCAIPVHPDDEQAAAQVSCGPTVAGVTARIIDQEGRQLPDREVGEIAIESNCMLTEYYQSTRSSAPLTADGWYLHRRYGLCSRWRGLHCGSLQRPDYQCGQEYVYPQDIEAIINTVPGVHPGPCGGLWCASMNEKEQN